MTPTRPTTQQPSPTCSARSSIGAWLLAVLLACVASLFGPGLANAASMVEPERAARVASADADVSADTVCAAPLSERSSDAASGDDAQSFSPEEVPDDHLAPHEVRVASSSSGRVAPLPVQGKARAAFTTPPPRPSGRV